MPAVLTYPGVYIEELPSGVRTIPGVATSIAAFVGRTRRGPVDTAVVINSYADFERRFGGLWLDSPLSFAVQDFYLNGGGQAVVVRLFGDADANVARTAAQAVVAAAAAAVAGAADATAVAAAATAAITGGAGTVANTAATAVAAEATAQAVADTADKAAVVTAATGAVEAAVAAAAAASNERAKLTYETLVLEAAAPGKWGDMLRVRVDNDVGTLDPSVFFNLQVFDGTTGQIELFRNVSLDPAQLRRIDHVLERGSELVRVAGTLVLGTVPTPHAAPAPGADIWRDVVPATDPQTSSKISAAGSDGAKLTAADFTTGAAPQGGLRALDKADQINLLCIPPHELGGSIEAGLVSAGISYCASRRAMMIIDPPADWVTKEAALTGIDAGVGDPMKDAAVYFPRLLQPNPLRDGREEAFVPCGAVAGTIARTDGARGVWKAPAGLDATLVGVPALSVKLNDLENGELNIRGINCLRSMPGAGRVIWGARTRRGDDRNVDEWKYIPVRRTALYIEESLYRGTHWVVFEPNDEPLWASIRLNVGAFMNGMFRQGAFQGSTPRDAYFVACDKDTTTQADINNGIVNILVGFAPLKPAEFVVIKLQQMAGQITS